MAVLIALTSLVGCADAYDGGEGSVSTTSAPLTEAANDDGYVLTPFGHAHRTCVEDVGENASIDEDGSVTSRGVKHPPKGRCNFPLRRAGKHAAGAAAPSDINPTISGWLSDYSATATGMANNWFTHVYGSWLVPQKPSSYVGQTLFYFNGLDSTTQSSILQPVLHYGPSSAGGGNYWSTAVWYIDHFGNVYHSSLTSVSVGVTLLGDMDSSGCTAAGKCSWTVTMKHNGVLKNSMTKAGQETFNRAYPYVAEFYNFTACNQNPTQAAGMNFGYTFYVAGASANGRQEISPALTPYLDYSATPWCNWRGGGGLGVATFAF